MSEYSKTKLSENVTLEEVPNYNIRIYHIKTKMVDETIYDIYNISKIKDKSINKFTKDMIMNVLNINGIEEVNVYKYHIRITKAEAFDWSEDMLHDNILKIIDEFQKLVRNEEEKMENKNVTLKSLDNEFDFVLHEIRNAKAQARLPEWAGYWEWDTEKETVMMYTKEGEVLDIRQTDRVEYTLYNMTRKDWILVYPDHEDYNKLITPLFGYDIAERYIKRGVSITTIESSTYIKNDENSGLPFIYDKKTDDKLGPWIPNYIDVTLKCYTFYNNTKPMTELNK